MKNSIKKILNNLLNKQRFAVIATQDKNQPYTNLVTFLASKNFEKIYFPTSKNTKKYKNLSSNSEVSILIDNRVNKPKDIKKAVAITAVGKSKETKEVEIKKNFLKKHPYLKNFINSKNCAMIEIQVEKYIIVDNFQNINILNL